MYCTCIMYMYVRICIYMYMYVHCINIVHVSYILYTHTQFLGRHCYHFNCSQQTSLASLRHVLFTALQCGSMLLIQDTHNLSSLARLTLHYYLCSLQQVLEAAFRVTPQPSTEVREGGHGWQ